MEEHNAINEQQSAVVNYEEEYGKLSSQNQELQKVLGDLYTEYNKLKNTWLLQRVSFLFDVVKNDKFSDEVQEKAIYEISEFLFPTPKEENEEVLETEQ